MPRRPVTIRRWEIVGAFVALIVVSAVALWYLDRRVDGAVRQANTNAAALIVVREQNFRQNVRREILVRAARRADLRNCREIEKIKERIRATVRVNVEEVHEALIQLGIEPASPQGLALLAQAQENEREALERFARRDCKALTRTP